MRKCNWKNVLALLLCGCMLVAFGGCANDDAANETTTMPTETQLDPDRIVEFTVVLQDDTVCRQYGIVEVSADKAIDGQTKLVEKAAFDLVQEIDLTSSLALIPGDYTEQITAILEKYELPAKYEQSALDHEAGYYGMGTKPEAEEDSETESLVIIVVYGDGSSIRIETNKPSEIEGMKAMVTDLVFYHDSLF